MQTKKRYLMNTEYIDLWLKDNVAQCISIQEMDAMRYQFINTSV